MQVRHGEGVASYTGAESCACGREAASEALIGECERRQHVALRRRIIIEVLVVDRAVIDARPFRLGNTGPVHTVESEMRITDIGERLPAVSSDSKSLG